MTRLRSALLGSAILALLALASSAQAQGGGSAVSLLFGAAGKIISETSGQVRVQGQIVVAFHGDPATGCAASGLCAYSGTIVVQPGSGAFSVVRYRDHGRIERQVSLFVGGGEVQPSTAARVMRVSGGQSPGMCADTQSNSFGGPSATMRGGTVTIRLFAAQGDALATRCAGPVDGDLSGVTPTATIPLERFARGRLAIDLTGTRSFAAHGFAGTVTSTLTLVLGKPSRNPSQPQFPPGLGTARIRTVTEQLTLTRLSGDLSAGVQGVADPFVCRLLDSCGLTGTIAFAQTAHAFTGNLVASGPASRPQRDFLAALGLAAGNPRGIAVGALAEWSQGPVTASLTQSGPCTDTAPGGIMFITLASRRGGLSGFATATPGRDRCPGPFWPSQGNPLLGASVSRGALGHRTFTIGLRATRGVLADDGYTMTLQGHLSLVVRRGRISQHVITEPTG